MYHFLKIIHKFFLLVRYDRLDKTCYFFKLPLILLIRKLVIKRDTLLS